MSEEEKEEEKQFIVIEPRAAGLNIGVYGLSSIEALGLMKGALMFVEAKFREQVETHLTHLQSESTDKQYLAEGKGDE